MNLLQKLNPENFDQLYHLMETSFPVDEHRPYAEQKALLAHPPYQIYTVSGEDESTEAFENSSCQTLRAFVAVWDFQTFYFLEHFAVNPAFRNHGLGACVLQELQALLSRPLCLEVELPDTELAKRRIAFYERNGFYYNDYPYIQPALSYGQGTVPLRIMSSGQAISPEEFAQIKEVLYTQVYHVLP